MATKVQVVLFLIFVSVNCFATGEKFKKRKHSEDADLYQNRFKRENYILGRKNTVRAAQPNVVVMPSVPNNVYGGVPSSPYGVARNPTVVVMPNDVYNTPVLASPYGVPTRL